MTRSLLFAGFALLASACVSAGQGAGGTSGVVALSEVDVEPVQLGCPINEPPRIPPPDRRVRLAFVVRADGTVEPGSVRLMPDHHSTAPERLIEEARDLATRCTYEPAQVAGRPVAVRIHESFWFAG